MTGTQLPTDITAGYVDSSHVGGAFGWGTALQTGRSRVLFPTVSLEIFIDMILPAALVALMVSNRNG